MLKLPLKFLFFILFTILLSLIGTILLIIIVTLICVLSPVIVIAASCSFEQKYIRILSIIFLPFLSALVIVFVILMFGLYPLLRKTNHHGIYDGFDLAINHGIKLYLKGLSCVF